MKRKSLLTILLCISFFLSSLLGTVIGYKLAKNKYQKNLTINKRIDKVNSSILESSIIPNVVESVIPWIVSIEMEYKTPNNTYVSQKPLLFSPLKENQRKINVMSGSGVILSSNGYILTNSHVVNNSKNINAILSTGKSYKAQIIGVDNITDIAVLKIKPKHKLPVAQIGNSRKLRIGEWVIAIGSPLGYDKTVTLGIISAINRRVRGIPTSVDFIQTDAAINPGNSGGPLVDIHGDVIGINTAIRADAQNIGFAIPINTAKHIAYQLINNGYVNRAWVGIEVKEFYSFKLDESQKGITSSIFVVDKVWKGGPAEKSGLKINDRILKVDNQPIKDVRDVQEKIRGRKIGQVINFEILRNNKNINLSVKTEKLPQVNN